MTRPILVCMSWRGGARFSRCLGSIARAEHHFSRIVLSVTGAPDSEDMALALAFKEEHPDVEVLCTEHELPTMQHQTFWVNHLERTGAQPGEWIFWLAYDDEVRPRGIDVLTDDAGDWPLIPGTVYLGPWAMRHEQPDRLWDGNPHATLEGWTCFPAAGPTRLPVMDWIADQIRQPTYIQMSGSVAEFRSYLDLRDGRPTKTGPMRIEMALAATRGTTAVAEFTEPVSIIYGRSNSDRAAYGRAARAQDLHLLAWATRYAAMSPSAAPALAAMLGAEVVRRGRIASGRQEAPAEEWRIRGVVDP